MSCACIPVIRHSIRTYVSPVRLQRRYARVHDVRFVASRRDASSIQEKYKDKLQQKAIEEGVESINDLKEVYKEKITQFRRAASTIALGSTPKQPSLQQTPPPPPQAPATSSANATKSGAPGVKALSSYLDLDKVAKLGNKEIEYIWRLRHANDPQSLCAMIPLETYKRIHQNAKVHPQFILPLPRPSAEDGSGDVGQAADGFEGGERTKADIHFLQWGFHPPAGAASPPETGTANTHTSTVIFTHLAAYKLHGTYAQPHTSVTHHLDLADSHGLVLLSGSVVKGRGVSPEEARWLLMCLQKFYDFEGHGGGVGKEKRQGLLQKFSKGDKGFDLEELVDEAERVS